VVKKKTQDSKSTKYLQKIEHTGDSCFYIGLGNTKTNAPTFEPYQCCPKPAKPQPQAGKEKTPGKSAKKETKDDEAKANGKHYNNNKKKEKRAKKDGNGKGSWWW